MSWRVFAVSGKDISTHSLGFAQFDCKLGSFIAPLPTGISTDLDIFGQYDVTHKADLDPVLNIPALRLSSEVGWASYTDVDYRFLSFNFDTGEASSLTTSRVARCRRFGSDALVTAHGRDFVWLPDLA